MAIIERKRFGGTCVNTGCMPTKTLVASAYAAQLARRSADYGVMIDGQIKVDIKRVKARKECCRGQRQRQHRKVSSQEQRFPFGTQFLLVHCRQVASLADDEAMV